MKEKNELENKKKTSSKRKTTNRINSEKAKKKTVKKEIVKEEKKVEKEENVEKKVVKKQIVNNDLSSTMFSFLEVIIIAFIAAIVGIFFTSLFNSLNEEEKAKTPNELREFLDIYYDITDEYYNDVDKKALLEAGIKGMIDYLGDAHSFYLDQDSAYSLNEELEGEFVGMGATITVDSNGNVYILDLYEDSPGKKAGFMVGDIIKKVDGVDMQAKDITEVSYKVKGKEGTKVDITILRGDEEKTITLTRGKVVLPSVSYHMTGENKVGYVSISVFAKNTPEQFQKAVNALIKDGAKSIIIDVRGNSGGYLEVATEIAGMFLEKGSVVYQLDTKGKIEKIKTTEKNLYNIDVAVLIDNESASASEILAAALNENINAPLVGVRTFGKGTVQKAKILESGAMIKYTIQEWYTPRGNKVDTVGVSPTHVVELSKEHCENPTYETDAQYKKAIEILEK